MHVYAELGVRRLVNAWGTVTRIGGSRMAPEALEAMRQAAEQFVDMSELARKSGERIARLLGVEAALVTAGAAAGLGIAAAACMAGTDPVKIAHLPDTSGLKNEMLVLKCHRFRYDQVVRMTGARFVEVGLADRTLPEEVEQAISDRTAGFLYLAEAECIRGSLSVDCLAGMLAGKDIPLIVDAAAELPPRENFRDYLARGAALVVFSGGKDIRGPQSSGLIVGSKSLITACAANSSPNHSVGRCMKVSKETMAGITKAVELYMRRDVEAEMERWERMVRRFVEALRGIRGVTVDKGYPVEPGIQPRCIPRAYVCIDANVVGLTPEELSGRLLEGDPGVAVGLCERGIVLNPQTLEVGEEEVVIAKLLEAFGRASAQAT